LPNASREPLAAGVHSPAKISCTPVIAVPSSLPRATAIAACRRFGGFESGITSPTLL
jgi:hypothetical protein